MTSKIEQLPDQLIFSLCFGHPREKTLARLLTKIATSTIVQHEPPSLIWPSSWPGERYIRQFQRNHIVTNEDLGRGAAIGWFDTYDEQSLAKIAKRKLAHAKTMCYQQLTKNYIEINQYMIRSFGEELVKLCPKAKLLVINISPIYYALAFRDKPLRHTYELTPNLKRNCINQPLQNPSNFQLRLWHWLETKVRIERLLRQNPLIETVQIDINEPVNSNEVIELCNHFGIKVEKRMRRSVISGSQSDNDYNMTQQEETQYQQFRESIPQDLASKHFV